MPVKGRNTAFSVGQGIEQEECSCSECGYTSSNRKNFRKGAEGGHVCSTGHYTDKEGNPKRSKNLYARGR